jgi:hypothetical protein
VLGKRVIKFPSPFRDGTSSPTTSKPVCRPAGLRPPNNVNPGLTSWATIMSPRGLWHHPFITQTCDHRYRMKLVRVVHPSSVPTNKTVDAQSFRHFCEKVGAGHPQPEGRHNPSPARELFLCRPTGLFRCNTSTQDLRPGLRLCRPSGSVLRQRPIHHYCMPAPILTSTENLRSIKCYPGFVQQGHKLFFETTSPMMLRLVLNVMPHSIYIRRAH